MSENPSFEQLQKQLDDWIAEGGEIAKVARTRKARLTSEDDYPVLLAEVENMKRYFKR